MRFLLSLLLLLSSTARASEEEFEVPSEATASSSDASYDTQDKEPLRDSNEEHKQESQFASAVAPTQAQEPHMDVAHSDEPIASVISKEGPAVTYAAKPAAPLPAQKAAASNEIEGIGIDTIDLDEPSGNWLHKRIWWERSQQRFDRLREKVGQVLEARMPFATQKSELEQNVFDPLYREVGVGQGELTVILSYFIQEIEQLRKKEGVLTKEERDFLDRISLEQKELEKLQRDVQLLVKIDAAMEEALNKLMEQGNVCRNYEKQAWNYLQIIVKELSDSKARELYYHIETLDKNVGDILKYIKTEFTASFEQLVKTAKEQAEYIRATAKALKEKGIDFKKQADVMEKQAAEREKERIKLEQDEAVERAVAETTAELSWAAFPVRMWYKVCALAGSLWDYTSNAVSSSYSWIKSFFVSNKSEEVVVVQEVIQPAVPLTDALSQDSTTAVSGQVQAPE